MLTKQEPVKKGKGKPKRRKVKIVAGRGVARIYASASGSGVASASPASPPLSPRVVFLLGSGGVVKPLRPVAPPRPLKKRKISSEFCVTALES